MGLDDRSADCQTHAHAIRFRREEGLEYAFCILESPALIHDLNANLLVHGPEGADFKRPSALLRRTQRFDCIADEIDEDLLNLNAIDVNHGKFAIEFCIALPCFPP